MRIVDVIYGSECKDCFLSDMIGIGSELCFNDLSTMHGYNLKFSFWNVDSSDLTYCDFVNNSHNCFGCVGLNHGEFCILNKKYSKQEYENLVARIINHMKRNGEWAQFFPAHFSCFGYNETTAGLYWPLSKAEALKMGFNWRDESIPKHVVQTYNLVDSINEVREYLTDAVLECQSCGKNYRILSQELKWHKKHFVPIPRKCSDCRMKLRAGMRNPRRLWARSCMKCGVNLQSAYAPDRPEKICCEKCYLEEVY